MTELDTTGTDELDELVAEFLVEAGDGADQLERDLVALERDPTSRDLQNGIFRTVHTLKGTSSLLGFERISGLAHVTEALLVGLREGRVAAGTDLVDVLLQFVDVVRRLLAAVEAEGCDDGVDVAGVVTRAQALAEAGTDAPVAVQEERPLGTVLVESGQATADAVGAALASQLTGDPRPLGEILVANGAVTREALERVLGQQKRRAVDRAVRVDPELLDRLLDLVDDLAAARDLLLRNLSPAAATELRRSALRVDLATRELLDGVAATRLQQVDHVWAKIPRLVRDVAGQCGKRVELRTHGGGIKVDRVLLDAVRDPLTHLVRNAVDHGIETPERRALAGKPATGVVLLGARQEPGRVVIEVGDDGAGIDPDTVAAAAVARGLVTAQALAALTAGQRQRLVMAPGFSTAAEVTSISGRGVGMDVVLADVERLGGTVELDSRPGAGTTVRLCFPVAAHPVTGAPATPDAAAAPALLPREVMA